MPLLKTLGYKHLNTLYVDIKRHICYFNLNWIINLNTLYVDIKPADRNYSSSIYSSFKYIIC